MSNSFEYFCRKMNPPALEEGSLSGLPLKSSWSGLLDNFELVFKESLNLPLISEVGGWTTRNAKEILLQLIEKTNLEREPSSLSGQKCDRSIMVERNFQLVQLESQKKQMAVVVTCGVVIKHKTENNVLKIFFPRRWREPVLNGIRYEATTSLDLSTLYRKAFLERDLAIKNCTLLSQKDGTSIKLKLDHCTLEEAVIRHVLFGTAVLQLTTASVGVGSILHDTNERQAIAPSEKQVLRYGKGGDEECKPLWSFTFISGCIPLVLYIRRYDAAGSVASSSGAGNGKDGPDDGNYDPGDDDDGNHDPGDDDDGNGDPGDDDNDGDDDSDEDDDDNNASLCTGYSHLVCFGCIGALRHCSAGCTYYIGYSDGHGYFVCTGCLCCGGRGDCRPCSICGVCHRCAHFGCGYVNYGRPKTWRLPFGRNKYDFYDLFDFDRKTERQGMKRSRMCLRKHKKRGKDKQKRRPRQKGKAKYFRDYFDDDFDF